MMVGIIDVEEIPRSIKRELINKFFDFNDKACISNEIRIYVTTPQDITEFIIVENAANVLKDF